MSGLNANSSGTGVGEPYYKSTGPMEAIPRGKQINATKFAQSKTGQSIMKDVQAIVESLQNPMSVIRESGNGQIEKIQKVLQLLGDLPKQQVMPYLEKHPELKVLLGMKQ